jgi:hypothetical protein
MNSSNNDHQSEWAAPEEVTTAIAATSTEDRQEVLRTKGSDWAREALKGITEMHQNEYVRKEVARRLF